MKYKCIKDVIVDGNKIIAKGNIVEISEDKEQLYNITAGVDIKNVDIDIIIQHHLENIVDNCSVSKISAPTKHPFQVIIDNMFKTYCKKNHDYGNSFDRSLDKFGIVASAIRIGDKMNRLETLTQSEAQVYGESIRDTLLDMANYAIMTVMWMDKH